MNTRYPLPRGLAVPGAVSMAVLAAVLVAGCATPPPPDMGWVGQARGVATAVPPKLLAVLQTEIAHAGPEGAIAACREQAPLLARAASEQTGWNVRRVSLRNRNPKAVPDAWERSALEDFDRRAAAREAPATLERADVVMEQGQAVQRYMRALPTLELCTQCHGTPDRLSPAVAERLKQLYPADKATGYQAGEIRGAMSLRRTAPH